MEKAGVEQACSTDCATAVAANSPPAPAEQGESGKIDGQSGRTDGEMECNGEKAAELVYVQPRVMTIEERLSRMEVPIKYDFLKPILVKAPESEGDGRKRAAPGKTQGNASKKQKISQRKLKKMRKEAREADRVCLTVSLGKPCEYGDNCRFPHDMAVYLKTKPPDISSECHVYSTFGECPAGFRCRFVSAHLKDGQLTKLPVTRPYPDELNFLPTDLKVALRKTCQLTPANAAFVEASRVNSQLFFHEVDLASALAQHAALLKERAGAASATGGDKAGKGSNSGGSSGGCNADVSVDNMHDSHNPATPSPSSAGKREGAGENGGIASNGAATTPPSAPGPIPNGSSNTQNNSQAEGSKPCGTISTCAADGENGDGGEVRTTDCGFDASLCRADDVSLRPKEKKKVDFRGKLVLAPLTTVGNLPFRRICKEFGVDITVGEMAMCRNINAAQPSEWALLRRHPIEDVFGVQLCSSNVKDVVTTCQILNDSINVDFVDLNCGCPIDLVTKMGAGSALPEKTRRFSWMLASMNFALDCPMTVKVRTGIDEKAPTLHNLVPNIHRWGPAALTIHGRSQQQRYSRRADWEYVGRCKALADPSLPVIGNGDVLSFSEAEACKEVSGVDGLMIARGALIKPWLFQEIKERRDWDISAQERLDIVRKYCNYGLEHWGSDTRGVDNTRHFLLQWMSFLHRYIPLGLVDGEKTYPINMRSPPFTGRTDLETLLASPAVSDWVKVSEMFLGPVGPNFHFEPKHKANAYASPVADLQLVEG